MHWLMYLLINFYWDSYMCQKFWPYSNAWTLQKVMMSHAKTTSVWKKSAAKQNRNIPGSECMNRLVIRSDIRIQPKLCMLNTLILHWTLVGQLICFQPYPVTNFIFKTLTREHKSHNYLSFGRFLLVTTYK